MVVMMMMVVVMRVQDSANHARHDVMMMVIHGKSRSAGRRSLGVAGGVGL